MIAKLKKLTKKKFEEFVETNQKTVQSSDPEVQEYILARWGDRPFPYLLPALEFETQEPAKKPEPDTRQVVEELIPPEPPQKYMLTRAQRRIAELIAASTDEPDVVVGDDLAGFKDPLKVPDGIRKDGYKYRWVSIQNLETQIKLFGGQWVPVNRTNHPHADPRLFDITGGLVYAGQVVLCHCRRETMDAREKKIIREFNFKTQKSIDELSKEFRDPSGKVVAHTELAEDPGAGPRDITLTDENDYDYEAPL